MPLDNGERQVAPSIEGIRADHRARYEWAASILPPNSSVIDFACGVGYGAKIMADAGHKVFAADRDKDAIAYAEEHYGDLALSPQFTRFAVIDAAQLDASRPNHRLVKFAPAVAAVCFETIEHIEDPRPMLRALRDAAPTLLASVPNEAVFPHGGRVLHHFRHYTWSEFDALLGECGWKVTRWWGQDGPESPVEPGVHGRTLVVEAERANRAGKLEAPLKAAGATAGPLTAKDVDYVRQAFGLPANLQGKHVAIVGLGPSAEMYMAIAKRLGGAKAFADETWGINALGGILQCDRVFHMDDVRIQEVRAAAQPQGNIAAMLRWLKTTATPVITSRAHPEYKALVEFPLGALLNDRGYVYFNSTAAYAVAYAIHKRVRKISLFGFDFTYPNTHHGEKGRACVEFWLGVAIERGIEIEVAENSSLLDTCEGDAPLYGYDTLDVKIDRSEGAAEIVTFTPKAALPTAEEIERRYDHTRSPNPLLNPAAMKGKI